MSLSSAMHTAQSIFSNTGTQTSTVSKNMANSGNPDYARRSSVTTTTIYGAQIVTTERAQNVPLLRQNLLAISQDSGQQSLLSGLKDMKAILGGDKNEKSPSTYIALLQDKIHEYATRPSDLVLGASVISTAQDAATAINRAAEETQRIRANADVQIETQVDRLNNLLSEFKIANDIVTSETALNGDPNDALDRRESLLKQISEIVGVSIITRENNDMILYTSEGTTLFETSPRKVSFEATPFYSATTNGKSIYIDGVAVDESQGANSTAMGSFESLLQMRDTVAPTFQKQLDEMARGLITLFAETSNALPTTTLPGLFTWAGGTVPTAATVQPGLANALRVSTAATANPALLRDGAINGAAYTKNAANNGSYSATLAAYDVLFDKQVPFAPNTGLDDNKTLLTFSSSSVSWLEALRSNATVAGESKMAMLSRTTEAYSNVTGVSLDEELSLLLDLEQSYKASTKLVSAIDEMLQALLAVAG